MLAMLDFREYQTIALNTNAFKGVELDLMEEILGDWKRSPGEPYTVLELRDGKTLASFAIIQRVSGRNFTFDLRYLVLDRDYHATSAIHHMLKLIDTELLRKIPFAVIRLEISGAKYRSLGEKVLEEAGYCMLGHIQGHFGEHDDFYYYVKAIFRNPPRFIKIDKPFEDTLPSLPQDDGEEE
ncbi:MAG: hypothetical protein N2067_03245 [Spirochaetaceae bacterium]|nr:hypothetical protein [Spirochaetaceae bacterium]